MNGNNLVVGVLILSISLASSAPTSFSEEDHDMPDDYHGSNLQETLPRYEFLMEENSPPPPTAADIVLPIIGYDKKNVSEERVKNALKEMDLLSEILDLKDEYMDSRQKEDPSWISSLMNKIQSGDTTEEDAKRIKTDLFELLSTFTIMKTMEERLVLVNEYVESTLQKDPNADLSSLFDSKTKEEAAEELFSLKFSEAMLHTANGFIMDAIHHNDDDDDTPNPVIFKVSSDDIKFNVDKPASPAQVQGKDEPSKDDNKDDVVTVDPDADAVTFLFLLFAATGFFFVLFVILYAFLKCLKQFKDLCFEGGVRSNIKSKSKYEQI